MKINKYILILLLTVFIGACTVISPFRQQEPPKTQLQTREFQTREFDTNNTKLILKAMVNVLQDDGFVIKNADAELGLIFATKEINLVREKTNSSNEFWVNLIESMANNNNNRQKDQSYNKIKIVEASINVTELGKRSKVRANFQAKVLDNMGNAVDVYPVEDAKYYQDFFSKVDKGVFLQKQGF